MIDRLNFPSLFRYNYFDQVLDIELADECFENAAHIYLEMLQFTKASEYFTKAGKHELAVIHAISAVRHNCVASDIFHLKVNCAVDPFEGHRTLLTASLNALPQNATTMIRLELDILEGLCSRDTAKTIYLMETTVKSISNFSRLQLLTIFRCADVLRAETPLPWRDYLKVMDNLNSVLKIVLPTLERASKTSGQSLSLMDRGVIEECAAFFEGKLVLKGLLTAMSAVHLFALSATKSVFGKCEMVDRKTFIILKLSVFARAAADFFTSELKSICSVLSSHLMLTLKNLEKLNIPSFIMNLSKDFRIPIPSTTQERLDLLLPLSHVLRIEENRSDYSKANLMIYNICFPEFSFLEDMKVVSEIRLGEPGVKDSLSEHLTNFKQVGLKADLIVKRLLVSELIGNSQEEATHLDKICTTELRNRKMKGKVDFRLGIISAFVWEQSEHSPPDFALGSFLHSLYLGFTNLDNDCWQGTIASRIYGAKIPETAKEKDDCISPQIFLKLIQKYTVLVVAIRKNYSNVLLPNSVFEDVICRSNRALWKDIHGSCSSESSSERRTFSNDLAHRIFKLLEGILTQTSSRQYFQWFQANSQGNLNQKLLEQNTAAFILSLVVAVKTIAANINSPILYRRFNDLSAKLDPLALKAIPETIIKRIQTKTNGQSDLISFR